MPYERACDNVPPAGELNQTKEHMLCSEVVSVPSCYRGICSARPVPLPRHEHSLDSLMSATVPLKAQIKRLSFPKQRSLLVDPETTRSILRPTIGADANIRERGLDSVEKRSDASSDAAVVVMLVDLVLWHLS